MQFQTNPSTHLDRIENERSVHNFLLVRLAQVPSVIECREASRSFNEYSMREGKGAGPQNPRLSFLFGPACYFILRVIPSSLSLTTLICISLLSLGPGGHH